MKQLNLLAAASLIAWCSGCGIAQQSGADEITFHAFFGESEGTLSGSTPMSVGYEKMPTTAITSQSSDSDFWMLGASVTFYLNQAPPKKHHVH